MAGIFPHYTRLFSANILPAVLRKGGKLILWTLLALSVAANIIILNPGVLPLPLLKSAQIPDNDILGTSDQIGETQKNKLLAEEYRYWTEIIQDHPDYRDAHVHAAIIAHKLGHTEDSRNHLNKVRNLDPNYPEISSLEALLGN